MSLDVGPTQFFGHAAYLPAPTLAPPTAHPKHYYEDGNLFLQIENTLYRMHRSQIVNVSVVFKELFEFPAENNPQGITANNPIILHPPEPAHIFDLMLLGAGYGGELAQVKYLHSDLMAVLRLSELYQAKTSHAWAIRQIFQRNWDWHPSDLIKVGLKYKDSDLFEIGFKQFAKLSPSELAVEHFIDLDVLVILAYVKMRDALIRHRCIVAAEPPSIPEHDIACTTTHDCEVDWRAVWWNGMGRYLLDGRFPLGWDDSFLLFERLKFGRMHPGCTRKMLVMAKGGDGLHFPESKLIRTFGKRLSTFLIPEPILL